MGQDSIGETHQLGQLALTSRLRSQQRRAGATVISCPPAHGRAFAPGPAGSGLIAGFPEDKRPKISRSFRAAPAKPDCRAARAGFLRTVSGTLLNFISRGWSLARIGATVQD
jgi:hypothetical protein